MPEKLVDPVPSFEADSYVRVSPATFAPEATKTTVLTVGSAATSAPVALPASTATAYRVRNPVSSASPVTWVLTTDSTKLPVIPTPYSTAGTGGVVGDKTMDPGGVEIIGLTPKQRTALAAGLLYLRAICPAGGSATIAITPGSGA